MSQEANPIEKGEVEEFARKLEAWSAGLPARERALLQLILAQSRQTDAADVQGFVAATSVKDAATAALGTIADSFAVAPMARPRPWVQMGEPWLRYKKAL